MIKENIKIALNSSKEVFLFQVVENYKLGYSTFDSNLKYLKNQVLYDEHTICYDLYIDKSDTLHLVSLINTGELMYYKCLDNTWSSAIIGKFDLNSNIYKQIEILFIKDELHIIYNLSNLINSNVWTIQHVIYDGKIKEMHNIARYISTRNPEYFLMDVDSNGTIHLVYNTNINKPQVFHSFYNPFSNTWSSKANKVSETDRINLFPYLFIDTKDNIHMLWLEFHKNKYNIKYLKMNSKGKEKFIWKQIKLLNINISKYPAIIFEEDNILKLIFTSDSHIKSLKSGDFGNAWSEEEKGYDINKNTKIVTIKSKIYPTMNKINHSYCKIEDNIKFYFLEMFKESSSIIEEYIQGREEREKILAKDKNINISPIISAELNKKLDNILENQNSIEELIAKILKYQEYMDIKLDDIYEFTESDKKTLLERLFSS